MGSEMCIRDRRCTTVQTNVPKLWRANCASPCVAGLAALVSDQITADTFMRAWGDGATCRGQLQESNRLQVQVVLAAHTFGRLPFSPGYTVL